MLHVKSIALCALLVAATASGSAFAHRPHGHRGGHHGIGHHGGARIGLHFGGPLFAAPLYAYPYYSHQYFGYQDFGYRYGGFAGYGAHAPSTVIIGAAAQPQVYVEQTGPAAHGPASDGYWYYCRNPAGYYPSVAQCSGSWQRVASSSSAR